MTHLVLVLVSACLLFCHSGGSRAEAAELNILAPSPPGSGWDQAAQALRAALGEAEPPLEVGVLNVPGGSGLAGLNRFISGQAEADLLVTGLTMLDASVVSRSPGKLGQLTPIARLAQEHYGLVVGVDSPFETLRDLRNALAADPGKVSFAGGPVGSVDHVGAILLVQAIGIDAPRLNYVPFLASADALAAAIEGKVGAAFLGTGELIPALAAKKVRLLAVGSTTRLAGLDAPTFVEAGIPFTFGNWRGVVGKPGLSRDDQARLANMVTRAAATRPWRLLLEEKRWDEALMPAEAFGDFVQQEHARLKGALVSAGILKRQND